MAQKNQRLFCDIPTKDKDTSEREFHTFQLRQLEKVRNKHSSNIQFKRTQKDIHNISPDKQNKNIPH